MSQTTSKHSPEEVAEIEKHKYFLSEKVGHDVGWEVAEHDWESNHADEFRQNAKMTAFEIGVRRSSQAGVKSASLAIP